MDGVKIVALCIVAAVLYGIAHDQITSRICVEYFTRAHPRIIASESPTALGLLWGVIATWWVGLGLGLPLAAVARLGRRPKLDARSLSRSIALVLLGMATIATAAGFAGYRLARLNPGLITFPDLDLPRGREPSFVAVASAHAASYASGLFGGLLVLGWALSRRLSAPTPGSIPPGPGPWGTSCHDESEVS
jgi:hypothetical protein